MMRLRDENSLFILVRGVPRKDRLFELTKINIQSVSNFKRQWSKKPKPVRSL